MKMLLRTPPIVFWHRYLASIQNDNDDDDDDDDDDDNNAEKR